jgi:YHS domain-containing protein
MEENKCKNCGDKAEFKPQGNLYWFCSDDCYDAFCDLDEDEYEDNFTTCDNCDLPDACRDFRCAIKAGIKKNIIIN